MMHFPMLRLLLLQFTLLLHASHAYLVPHRSPTSTALRSEPEIVSVPLAEGRNYPIYIGADLLNSDSETLASHAKGNDILIVSNTKIAPLYLARVESIFKSAGKNTYTCILPDGEEYKDLPTLNLIYDEALKNGLDRKCTFVALGGGVIGDMVGYAAASYQRGVDFIQVPTSVMAMVDSSVGGKTGVNHALGKNMIGAFHQPNCVFIDTNTLETLPDRELKSGISEIIKYGLIRDAPFFEWQEKNIPELLKRNPTIFAEAIKRSCENKAEVVAADEKEAGVRATLNLGHTFGHAVENGSGYGHWLHGEAVAIGTAMATDMSARMGWIDESLTARVQSILKLADLPTELPGDSPMTTEKFLSLMSVDKKVANGVLRLILLKGELGNCVFTSDFDDNAMKETIDLYVSMIKEKAAKTN
ncbi:hypothetical protein TrST_g4798 [Triparma strigata]|uniref:3-dehydroquinate synthase, chloroplastic n=1 Tax=Triparma strigata TaxID=1606541 RepID=A0A9W7BDK7_9STRA|nr:hypothetical protein TrST_g4798 [Triparma strigata]